MPVWALMKWKCVATRAVVADSAPVCRASETRAADPAPPNADCHLDRLLDGQCDTRRGPAGQSAWKARTTPVDVAAARGFAGSATPQMTTATA